MAGIFDGDIFDSQIFDTGAEEVVSPGINIELLRRKREKERLEFILAEDEELFMAVAAAMEVIKKRWVH